MERKHSGSQCKSHLAIHARDKASANYMPPSSSVARKVLNHYNLTVNYLVILTLYDAKLEKYPPSSIYHILQTDAAAYMTVRIHTQAH